MNVAPRAWANRAGVLVLGRRRSKLEHSPNDGPQAAGQEEARAERGGDAEVEPNEDGKPGQRHAERKDEHCGRDAGAESLTARDRPGARVA